MLFLYPLSLHWESSMAEDENNSPWETFIIIIITHLL